MFGDSVIAAAPADVENGSGSASTFVVPTMHLKVATIPKVVAPCKESTLRNLKKPIRGQP